MLSLVQGCSVLHTLPKLLPVQLTASDLGSLQASLQHAPTALRKAVLDEAQAGLLEADASVSNKQDNTSSEAVLQALLSSTSQVMLSPDAEFEVFDNIVNGNQLSIRQSFIAALSAYLTSPSFHCQQPLYFRYFQQRYYDSRKLASCSWSVPFAVMQEREGLKQTQLDMRRVRFIHLLFAGEGEALASRFGHVALRLIVCPEAQSSSDADCNANLAEHVVLGFGAHVNDLELDIVKALKGDYQAYLFAANFLDTYRNYAISEFREVYSVPFNINTLQREQMLSELSEIHWRFKDDYAFFSKNCTGLLQQALNILLPGFDKGEGMDDLFIRPDSFFEAVKGSDWLETYRLDTLEMAEQEGYYFSSTKPFYDRAVEAVLGAMSAPEFDDVDGYLEANPVMRRKAIESDVKYAEQLRQDEHLLEAQLMLEELAIIRSERRIMTVAANYFKDLDVPKIEVIRRALNTEQLMTFESCLLTPIKLIAQPIPRLAEIPDIADVPQFERLSKACKSEEGRESLRQVLDILKNNDPEHWEKIAAFSFYMTESYRNVEYLQTGLKSALP